MQATRPAESGIEGTVGNLRPGPETPRLRLELDVTEHTSVRKRVLVKG